MRAERLDLLAVSSCAMTAVPACLLTVAGGRGGQMSDDRRSIVIQPIVVPPGTPRFVLRGRLSLNADGNARAAALAGKSSQTGCLGEGSKVTRPGLEAGPSS